MRAQINEAFWLAGEMHRHAAAAQTRTERLTTFLVVCREVGFVGIDDEDSEQARGLSRARVFADTVTIARKL